MDKQDVQHEQAVNNAKTMESKSEYKVGDIVWAKLIGCPFWPGIVTCDPESRLCIKGKKKTFALHVRFCSYYGQRNWVRIIEKYCSKEDLVSKYPDCMVSLKKNKKEMVSWHAAVQEADHLMTLERKERMLHFCSKYKLDYFKELDINGSSDDPALQSSNLNYSGVFHDATPSLIINENIKNNDTTYANDSDATDHDAAEGPTIQDLLIDFYGISQNDVKPESEELDLDNLKPYQGSTSPHYILPTDLKNRISEFEKRQETKFTKKKEINSRRL